VVQVQVTNLTKRFGAVTAVDDVSLTIGGGELFFLLGPSGCGKTTLLRLVAGFLEPDAGEIHFDDRRIDTVPAQHRNTGMVFQNYALWPHMNVWKNVRYGLDVRGVAGGEKRLRVGDALSLVRMAGYENRLPGELSGGQQQRVALARALVVEPDVVLLDEPLSNLDAKLRLEMRAEIRRIHATSPRTTIYVTHDQKEALSMADRIALMRDGRIVQIGSPEEVYTRPASLFCARFIGNCNTVEGSVRGVEDGLVLVETSVGTLRASPGEVQLKPGDRAVVAFRPELLRPAEAGEANAFETAVASRMYLGETVQVTLHAKGVALAASVVAGTGWSVGETAVVCFDAREAHVFGAEREHDA